MFVKKLKKFLFTRCILQENSVWFYIFVGSYMRGFTIGPCLYLCLVTLIRKTIPAIVSFISSICLNECSDNFMCI